MIRILALFVTLAIVGIAVVVRFPALLSVAPSPPLTTTSPQFGVITPNLANNSHQNWDNLGETEAFDREISHKTTVVPWYADWTQEPNARQLDLVEQRHSIIEVTWEPWSYSAGRKQGKYSLQRIVGGEYDSYIERWAHALRGHKGSRIRFAQEMNGDWYPWGIYAPGNSCESYVAAWRHVHDIFREARADNVSWVWAPITGIISRDCYPGPDYADIVGLSGFNGGSVQPALGGWREFDEIFTPWVKEIRTFAPDKPFVISETASSSHGGSRPEWVRHMITTARQLRLAELTWYDLNKEADWSIDSDAATLDVMKEDL